MDGVHCSHRTRTLFPVSVSVALDQRSQLTRGAGGDSRGGGCMQRRVCHTEEVVIERVEDILRRRQLLHCALQGSVSTLMPVIQAGGWLRRIGRKS